MMEAHRARKPKPEPGIDQGPCGVAIISVSHLVDGDLVFQMGQPQIEIVGLIAPRRGTGD